MELVNHEEFLKRLAELFNKCNSSKGSIWLTHKRLTYEPNGPPEGAASDREYPCLVRAVDGRDAKFSTTVSSAELPKFHTAYSALLRQSMPGLRKRDKKKEKIKAEAMAARRQRLETDVVITGSKRGRGRAKRQRRVKAAIKQQETRKLITERQQAKANKKL
ncbi:Signal recognition particle 14 kDa protein [Ceratobasidium theobromae]|uniref:Signal recognition particle subunit SRP14 n=1 Tax=Ceratobasidium theobromae TaxID=1582974 RepID=A0A5N5Q8U5_9AGAM|nr:Signal recognition particle 14 kDa protein [Ceratobasidium theobromae]